ncbi:MAG: prephenate dehydrogenase/arogenate dehydrogenase family protein [Planctomycetota bacterium]
MAPHLLKRANVKRRGMRFGTVGIVGVGLIGGSIGLALRKGALARRVVGIGYRRWTLTRARRLGAIDEATCDLARGVRDADLVVVCTPVGLIPELVKEAARHAPERCVLADAGSTKLWITRELARLPAFVPSHPIAGGETRGNDAARGDLFRGALCVITPGRGTDDRAVSTVTGFWRALGMPVVRMTAARHDDILGATSHLPHVVACALAAATRPSDLPYVGRGFLDATRIAQGDPALWGDILLTNRRAVADRLEAVRGICREVEGILRAGDRKRLVRFLRRAKRRREGVRNHVPG